MPFRLTARAADDLFALTEYGIEAFGSTVARRYQDGLHRAFELIAELPAIGQEDARRPGIRRFLHGRHVIIYRVVGADVVVVRLLHASMDSTRQDLAGDDEGSS